MQLQRVLLRLHQLFGRWIPNVLMTGTATIGAMWAHSSFDDDDFDALRRLLEILDYLRDRTPRWLKLTLIATVLVSALATIVARLTYVRVRGRQILFRPNVRALARVPGATRLLGVRTVAADQRFENVRSLRSAAVPPSRFSALATDDDTPMFVPVTAVPAARSAASAAPPASDGSAADATASASVEAPAAALPHFGARGTAPSLLEQCVRAVAREFCTRHVNEFASMSVPDDVKTLIADAAYRDGLPLDVASLMHLAHADLHVLCPPLDSDPASLCRLFGVCTRVRVLCLRRTNVDLRVLETIGEHCHDVRHIDLSECSVVRNLRPLQRCTSLQTLWVARTRVTADSLADVMASCRALVSVCADGVSLASGFALPPSIRLLALRRLILDGCSLTDDVLATLMVACPRVETLSALGNPALTRHVVCYCFLTPHLRSLALSIGVATGASADSLPPVPHTPAAGLRVSSLHTPSPALGSDDSSAATSARPGPLPATPLAPTSPAADSAEVASFADAFRAADFLTHASALPGALGASLHSAAAPSTSSMSSLSSSSSSSSSSALPATAVSAPAPPPLPPVAPGPLSLLSSLSTSALMAKLTGAPRTPSSSRSWASAMLTSGEAAAACLRELTLHDRSGSAPWPFLEGLLASPSLALVRLEMRSDALDMMQLRQGLLLCGTTLRTLSLAGCPHVDDSVVYDVVQSCGALVSLDVSTTGIADVSLMTLTQLPQLARVDLSFCDTLTARGLGAFVQQLHADMQPTQPAPRARLDFLGLRGLLFASDVVDLGPQVAADVIM